MKTFRKNISKCTVLLGLAILVQGCGGGSDSNPNADETGFVFSTEGPEAFTRIDRHAAVEAGTVGIAATAGLDIAPIRDSYNAANPERDAAGEFLGEIQQSVTDLHGALDDDLIDSGLIPATVETSLAQAGPVIVPDVMTYDPSQPVSYPNGRNLTDPVVDLTIAAALLDLGQGGQTLRTLADLPLNPPANDRDFRSDFPFLASPNL